MGYETFDRLCKVKGVSAYKVSKETGVSTATLSSWKKGTYAPKEDKLQKIADYFGVETNLIRLGDSQERNERYNNVAQEIRERLEHRSALNITSEEWELIEAFRYLNKEGQGKALSAVIDLTEIKKYRKEEFEDGYIRI